MLPRDIPHALRNSSVPPNALALGAAGLLPFVFLAVASLFLSDANSMIAVKAMILYGIVILSFMGGVHWGLAMLNTAAGKPATSQFFMSVVPALFAVASSLLPEKMTIIALIGGFIGLLVYDLSCTNGGLAPKWYPALRWPLTLVVSISLAVGAYAAPG